MFTWQRTFGSFSTLCCLYVFEHASFFLWIKIFHTLKPLKVSQISLNKLFQTLEPTIKLLRLNYSWKSSFHSNFPRCSFPPVLKKRSRLSTVDVFSPRIVAKHQKLKITHTKTTTYKLFENGYQVRYTKYNVENVSLSY